MSHFRKRPRRRAVLALAALATVSAVSGATGTPLALPQQSGAVDLLTQANVRIDGAATLDVTGYSVAGAGDVNGDGQPDAIIGASGASNNGRTASGSAYVVFGPLTARALDLSPPGPRGFRIDGAASGDSAGAAVAGAGDVNGDGRADVLVGALFADNNGRGASGSAYVVFGKRTADTVDLAQLGSGGFRIDGAVANDFVGRAVAGAGDVNGDGRPDVLLGAATDNNGRNDSGGAYVVFGKDTESAVDLADLGREGFRIDGAAAGDAAGWSVAGIGDVNGDRRADVLIGAPAADNNGRSGSGSAYVVFGKASTTPVDLARLGDGGHRIDGASGGDQAGYSVSSAGDLNGDRRPDILVGARNADVGDRADAGAVYLVYGKATTTSVDLASLAPGGIRIAGAAANDQLGRSVAAAGDVNGDGTPDLLLGADQAQNNGRARSGSAYVVFGNPSNRDLDLAALRSAGFRMDGAAAGDVAAHSVAGPGDLNGDGRPDALIGAPAAGRPGRERAGAAYVVFGFGRPQLAYRPLRAKVGSAIAPHAPARLARTGTPRFQVAPTLPAGLRIDALGVIRGTPTAAQRQTTHRVTMTDLTGSATASLEITVAAPDDERPPPTVPPPDPEEGGDTTAPALVVRAPSPQRVARQGSVRMSASCNEACRLQASGRIRVGRSSIRLVPARASLGAAGTKALRLRVTPAGKKRLQAALRRGLRAQAAITVRATDAAGNASTRSRVVRAR